MPVIMRRVPMLTMWVLLCGCASTQSIDYTNVDEATLATLSSDLNDKIVSIIATDGYQLRATILRLDADSAYYDREPPPFLPRTYGMRTRDIHAIEFSEKPLRPAVTGGVVGFFGGLLVGLGLENVACPDGDDGESCSRGLMIGTGLLGGVIGVFIGAGNPRMTRYVFNRRR